MRKFLMTLALLLLPAVCPATETPIPAVDGMQYTVTVKKIELYNSTLGQWVTAADTPTSFDIASVTAGAVAGNMISGATLSDGTYTQIRVTVSNQFSMKAFVSISGQGKCTSGTAAVGTNTFAGVANCSSIAEASAVTVTVDFTSVTLPSGEEAFGTDLRSTNAITSFTVGPGSSAKTASVTFDLNNVFRYFAANDMGPGTPAVITPGQPSVTQTID